MSSGYQPRHRARAVEVLHDHPRIEDGRAVVGDENRHLAERVVVGDPGVGVARRVHHELVLDALLGQNDPHLAREGAGRRSDELHLLDSTGWFDAATKSGRHYSIALPEIGPTFMNLRDFSGLTLGRRG